jgi:chemotaxis protein MotB
MKKTVVLLAVALMAGCVSEKTYQQEVQQVGTLSAQNKTSQALNQQLQAEVRADQVQITQLQDRLKVSMVDQLLFSEGGWELSAARATGVVRYLVAQGVNPNILSAQGFGDSRPVASNDTAQGRAKNRRVEIVIMAAGS